MRVGSTSGCDGLRAAIMLSEASDDHKLLVTPHDNGIPKLTNSSSLRKTYTEFGSHLLNDTC